MKYSFGFILFLFLLSCKSEGAQNSDPAKPVNEEVHNIVHNPLTANGKTDEAVPKLKVVGSSLYDFGLINEGDPVSHRFIIQNIGNAPMVIIESDASCGCTVPSYREGVIAPGDTSSILVKFDSRKRVGAQNKTVSIFTNTVPNETIFTLKGQVLK